MHIYILLLILASLFSALAVLLVKIATSDPIVISLYRMLLAVPILYLLVYTKQRNTKTQQYYSNTSPLNKPKLLHIHKKYVTKKYALLTFAGCCLAANITIENYALSLTNVANVTLLGNLAVIWLILFNFAVDKIRLHKTFILSTSITLAGLSLLVLSKTHDLNTDSILLHYKGNLLSLLASLFYALYIISLAKTNLSLQHIHNSTNHPLSLLNNSLITSLSGTLALLFVSTLIQNKNVLVTDPQELLVLFLISLFAQTIGQSLVVVSLNKVVYWLASLLLLLKPPIATLLAFLLLNENLSLGEVVGIITILGGVYHATLYSRQPHS